MSGLFNLGHVTQLKEIQDALLKRNQPGIGSHVEELIRRLTSGGVAGKSDDVREAQAKQYWDLGVGRELGCESFEEYLNGKKGLDLIPEMPEVPRADDGRFPHLVLEEPRLGLKRLCNLGNIEFDGDDRTFVEYDDRHADFKKPTWIRVQDGRRNRNRSVRACRGSFGSNERGLTALQGVCAYLLHSEAVSEMTQADAHAMDLSGSVRRDDRGHAASLKVWRGRAELDWVWDDSALPGFGSASCRELLILDP